jgi:hypothetical protein
MLNDALFPETPVDIGPLAVTFSVIIGPLKFKIYKY